MTQIHGELDRAAWDRALAPYPAECRDVYFTPAYHDLHERNGDGLAFCTLVEEGDRRLLVPGIRTAIPARAPGQEDAMLWDLQTCNGYGGPLAVGASGDFLERAWAAWREDCRQRGIVAGFFRLHPLLKNACFLPADAQIREDRQTVYLDFSGGLAGLWDSADPRFRNMVNKGRREHLEIRWNQPDDWADFESLYNQAMDRLGATEGLRFSPAYFAALASLPGAELAGVRLGGRFLAGSVFLFGAAWAHYHLAARAAEGGNHLHSAILQAAIEKAAERGMRGMHLGGGRTAAPDDGLLRFKTSAGGQRLNFQVALVVADRQCFAALCGQWQADEGRSPSWLLGYRQPRSVPEPRIPDLPS